MDLGLKVLLPHLSGVEVEQVEVTSGSILVDGVSTAVGAVCPGCRVPARRVHSRYVRRLADVAVGGRRVLIRVRVRRFFCEDDSCEARTFVEQVDGLTKPHARRSPPLRRMLEAISLAVCARAGARLAAKLGVAASRSGLLRLIRAMPDPPVPSTRVLGVDDFALKRGHVYGTVLIDCETRQVIDVLESRDAAPLAAWLDAHPGTEIICRDRSSAYADGARTGAPDAIQVADRFHLWQNLATAVERCVARHKSCLRPDLPPAEPEAAPAAPPGEPDPTGRLADRRREHHALVHDLLRQGMAIRQIAGHLGWGRHTVQRYARATTWQQMIVGRRRPATSLDPYKAHLQAGYTGRHGNTQALHREITARGFTGSYSTVRDYLQRCPTPDQPPPAAPPPSVRRVTGWICRHPDNQAADDIPALADILQRCPELRTAHQLVREFATMLTHRTGNTTLTTWITAAVAAELPGISTFAQHLTTDLDAVTAGLTLHWNSGPVEGNVNRIKMLKRQMYGRASFDLLRKRILLA